MTSDFYPRYIVNGIELYDQQGRWFLEAATVSPGTWEQEIVTVTAPNLDGVRLAGAPRRLSPGELAVSVGVHATNYAEKMGNLALVQTAFRGDIDLVLKPSPTTQPRHCAGRVKSFTVKEISPYVSIALATITLPYPVWTETQKHSGSLPAGTHILTGLAGGSAPVEVTWTLPVGLTDFRARCLVSGEETLLAPGDGLGKTATISGWATSLGARLESWGRLHPDPAGVYRVEITASHTVNFSASRSFL